MSYEMNRRQVLRKGSFAAAAAAIAMTGAAEETEKAKAESGGGGINHAVCKWCYKKIPLEEFAGHCVRLGIKGMDLMTPGDWPVLRKHGITCTMTPSHGIGKGLNDTANHEMCLTKIREGIEATSEAGYPNVICFSGNRTAEISDEEGLANCAEALKQVVGLAEEKGVTLCMELLNSKVNHKGYMCDHTDWGVELCKKVGSERFKLLYDIYHMQVMEGDIIRTIQDNIDYIGHIHTGGNPGRNEIDETQELYYPAIMRAIVATGFSGYVAQEFVPKRDPIESLAQAIEICDV